MLLSISSTGLMPSSFAHIKHKPSGSALGLSGFDIKTTAGLFLHFEHNFILKITPWNAVKIYKKGVKPIKNLKTYDFSITSGVKNKKPFFEKDNIK